MKSDSADFPPSDLSEPLEILTPLFVIPLVSPPLSDSSFLEPHQNQKDPCEMELV